MKETVTLSGMIVGQGRRADCKIQAIKVSLPGDSHLPEYTDYHILNSVATDSLPDGDYEVLVSNGELIKAKRKAGYFVGA